MLGAYAVVATLGASLALRYKAGALIALSVVVIAAGTVTLAVAGWPLAWAFIGAFGAAFALQCGYLLGAGLQCAASRARALPRMARRYVRNFGGGPSASRLRAP